MLEASAEEGSSGIVDGMFSADDESDDVYLDFESFWKVMGAPASPSQVVFVVHGSVSTYINWNCYM